MKIFIMIPIFNKENFTISCIKDLSYLDEKHNIIIVDNGSSEKSFKIVKDTILNLNTLCNFHIFKFDKNIGFGKASNYAYNRALELDGDDNDFYIFLNNDIRVKNNKDKWTDIMIENANNNLVGPTGGLVDKNYNFVYETEDPNKKINYMSGWCVGMFGNVAKKIANELTDNTYRGVFPDYNLAYFEDTHQGIIAKKIGLGFKIVVLPLVHFKRTTSKTLNLSQLYNKSRIEFLKRINDK